MKRPFFLSLAFTAGGSAAVAAVSLVRNVLIASVMGPAAFGLWNFCAVVLRLTVESHLGALSVLSVEAPIHRGGGRPAEARTLERRAVSMTLLFALAAGALGAAALCFVGGAPLYGAAALLGVTIVLQSLFFADATVLRSRGVFGRVALAQIAFALVHIAGLLWLVPSRYLSGALLAWAAALLVAVTAMRLRPAEPMPPPRPSPAGGDLVVRGIPTYLVGLTFVVLLQTDRVVVGALLGAEALGFYGILGLGASALLFLPDAFASVLLPMAGERFGRAGEDPVALARIVERATRGLAVVSASALAMALAGTDLIVAYKLPNFAAALPAARPYLAGVFLLALTAPLRFVLVTVGAGRATLLATLAAFTIAVALESAACLAGPGLVGVATASAAAAMILFGALLGIATARRVLTSRAALRLFAETILFGGAALACDAVLAGAAPWLRLAVPSALAALAAVQLVRWARATSSSA